MLFNAEGFASRVRVTAAGAGCGTRFDRSLVEKGRALAPLEGPPAKPSDSFAKHERSSAGCMRRLCLMTSRPGARRAASAAGVVTMRRPGGHPLRPRCHGHIQRLATLNRTAIERPGAAEVSRWRRCLSSHRPDRAIQQRRAHQDGRDLELTGPTHEASVRRRDDVPLGRDPPPRCASTRPHIYEHSGANLEARATRALGPTEGRSLEFDHRWIRSWSGWPTRLPMRR